MAHDAAGQALEDVHRDDEPKIARGRRVVLPRPGSLEDRGAFRHRDDGAGMLAHEALAVAD
jgi:hypothetical protein